MAQATTAYSTPWLTAPFTRPLTASELVRLERSYTLYDREAILRFLDQHQAVVPALFQAAGHIRTRFPQSPVNVRVVSSRGTLDSDEYIRVSIVTSLEPDEAVRRLKEFDEAWWLDSPMFSEGILLFTLEWV